MALSLLTRPEPTTETTLQPNLEPLAARRVGVEADLACLMCGRTVGTVVRGRAYHHAGCAGRISVQRGILRCCRCNGPVYREDVAPLTRH
jgi:hypothetical protein